jgi:phosphoribosylformylglycinamidine synthase subunit PurL
MALSDADYDLVTAELDREPTPAETTLFENLWSEHCAYRSSRPLLGAFDSAGEHVVVGPGDDAAVLSVPTDSALSAGDAEEYYLTFGIESHNHPSFVDPYDGAATGVGGIVRDTLSMGAYPIALADCLSFGDFDREHSQYLFEGVVEGIADYANAIGVPTVTGSVNFHPGYVGNPLVNVACVGLLPADRLVTAEAQAAGNDLLLVGNATGRDGLGGASFASEDLAEDAQIEDRPAVQVGDPYSEKLLIEANEALCAAGLIESARDLGAAGLGGASSELVAKGDLGARIDLDCVHQREPGMVATEILLAESQERMCYEVRPEHTERVKEVAERFELGCSVIGEVTEGRYVCTQDGKRVVDLPAEFLADGAPAYDRSQESVSEDTALTHPDVGFEEALSGVIGSPNTASKEWVYRQYDHEVGLRTKVAPGDDAALLAIRETGVDLAIGAGAEPNWTACDPRRGAKAIALEVATNLAVKGARPLATVDCLNGGNPENAETFGRFAESVTGLASMCETLSVPVVGGNVSLYNDSATGPIPETPTLAMIGIADPDRPAPPTRLQGEGTVLVVGDPALGDPQERKRANAAPAALGGSAYLARFGGQGQFPGCPAAPAERIDLFVDLARQNGTLAMHDVSHGGLAVSLAEMIGENGLKASIDIEQAEHGSEGIDTAEAVGLLCNERPGRAVIETETPDRVHEVAGDVPVYEVGHTTDTDAFDLTVGNETVVLSAESIRELRGVIGTRLD